MARSWLARRTVVGALLIGVLGWGMIAGPSLPTRAADLGALSDAAEPGPPTSADAQEATSAAATCTPLIGADAAGIDGVVSFQSLAQGNVFDHGPPRSLLIVAGRPDPIVAVIDPAFRPAVEGVDLGAHVLVGLFIGRWPQIGHRVSIETVRTIDGGVCVTAVLTGPAPGQDASDAEADPYHVVAVPRDALPEAPGTEWTVVSADGNTVATARFP